MRATIGLMVVGLVLVTQAASAEETTPTKAPAPAAAPAKPAKPSTRNDVAVGAALARTDQGVTLSATTEMTTATAGPSQGASPVFAGGGGLADVHVSKRASSDGAGEAREIQMTATYAVKTEKPMASIRHHRKLAVAQTLAALGPAFEGCRQLGAPATVAVKLDLAPSGEVERAMVDSPSKPVNACIVQAFNGAKFGAPGGQGVRLVVPVAVGSGPLASR